MCSDAEGRGTDETQFRSVKKAIDSSIDWSLAVTCWASFETASKSALLPLLPGFHMNPHHGRSLVGASSVQSVMLPSRSRSR